MTALDLLARHRPDDLVAFGGSESAATGGTANLPGDKTAADLLRDAARIAAALPAPRPGSHILLVLENDRYSMAAALIGSLARGHAVALPPNSRRDSILAVRDREETVAAIHDSDAGLPFRIQDLLREGRDAPPLEAPIELPGETLATVFTSGTTGPIHPWKKSRLELLGEAHMLGRVFDIGPGDRIVGTVPPGHIYGLLFTVLLPLARGAAFCRETPHHAEAVAKCVAQQAANVLVTVPVGLRAFSALAPLSFPGIERVFSSTGPLPSAVAQGFRERHAHPITEILGSTETGGIAWRERRGLDAEKDETWRPLEGVRLSTIPASDTSDPSDDSGSGAETRAPADGAAAPGSARLCVDSPYIHRDLARPFETQDLVRMNPDGSFLHLGRADGIVKIGGRRVSIQEVEDSIRQHPDVEDAAVAAIPAEGGRGHQLLAAVSPSSCSPQKIKRALRERFEPTCLPRRILCLDSLPKEINGKIPRARLLRLFDLRSDGRPINWTLEWGPHQHEKEETPSGLREVFEIPVCLPEDYAFFDGHFEEYPVLAGAAQLKELILPTVARAFPRLGRLVSMNRIKFQRPIRPGDLVVVRVSRGEAPDRIRFEIEDPGQAPCSTGHLVFSTPPREVVTQEKNRR